MPVETLYLHIGRGKTGTTSIQRFLSAHRELLREHGVHYVAADDARQTGHQNFAKSFIEHPPPYMEMPPNLERAREAVCSELLNSGSPAGLLSSENLTLVDPSELANFFRRSLPGVRVRIIFFARSQDELAESQYNQMVKLALCTKSFEQYVATELDELDFSALLEPWAAQFGRENIVARVFDASADTLVSDFLACLPLSRVDPELWKPAPVSNSSVGYLATQALRLLNQFTFPNQRAIYDQLNAAIKSVDLPPIYLDAAGARDFRERFGESNRRFLHQYLGRIGSDLGGRKYSDAERDDLYSRIQALKNPAERRTHT